MILPIAAIRGEGTSNDYLPPEVPALPAFELQRAVSTMIRDLGHDYWTGTVYTTNRRVWEHDDRFQELLRRTRAMAIDMETATIFAAGFANHIPTGALLLVSDQPMIPEGVKTEASRSGGDRDLCRKAHQDRHRSPEAGAAPRAAASSICASRMISIRDAEGGSRPAPAGNGGTTIARGGAGEIGQKCARSQAFA